MKKRIALLLALFLPVSALASGTWRTVAGEIPEEELWIPVSEYTGEVRMTFLGDCTLGGESPPRYRNIDFSGRIEQNGMDFPFRNLVALTGKDDLTVANLEVVLSDRKLTKEKKKFNFIGPTAYTEILTLGSIECVTIANNHSHDYGEAGYKDTKAALEAAGVCWFGTDAPAIWQSDEGLRIGFLGVSGSLSGNRAKQFQREADKLREAGCAAVITVMHAGTEYSYDPPDGYQKQITAAAVPVSDLIIGHHPHVVQGWKLVDGVPVVYSLGNCSFGGNTYAKDPDALVVQAALEYREGRLTGMELTFYPISITSDRHYNNYAPKLLTGEDAARVLKKMRESTEMEPGTPRPDGSAVLHIDLAGN